MANPTTSRGFKPVRMQGGAPYSGAVTKYKIASGYATGIAAGDPVKQINTGYINVAGATDTIQGVLVGVQYVGTDGIPVFKPNWVASTTTLGSQDAVALVVDDPNVIFETRMLNNSTAPTIAAIGNTFNSYNITTPTADGASVAGIDASTYTGTSTVWRLMNFVEKPDNDPTLANPLVHVAPALHQLRINTGT